MSTIKVDTVRPVTTDADLALQGDASGAGVTGAKVFGDGSLGADSITDLAGTGAPDFPNGLTLAGNTTGGSITGVTLDDYEEGTWPPTVEGATTPGSCTYTLQSARYVKIGDLVRVYGRVTFSGHTGSGRLQITGLPFTNNGGTDCPADTGYWSYGVLTSGYNVSPIVFNGADYIDYYQHSATGGGITSINVGGGGTFTFGATYKVA